MLPWAPPSVPPCPGWVVFNGLFRPPATFGLYPLASWFAHVTRIAMLIGVVGRPRPARTSCAHWTIVWFPVSRMSPCVVVLTTVFVVALPATARSRLAFFDQADPPRLPCLPGLNPGER